MSFENTDNKSRAIIVALLLLYGNYIRVIRVQECD